MYKMEPENLTLWERLFYTTVHIEKELADGRRFGGTGFIVSLKGTGFSDEFLVTNKHVIAEGKLGTIRFHSIDRPFTKWKGYKLEIHEFEHYWIGHRDPKVDVAIMSMSLIKKQAAKSGKNLFYQAIPQAMFPTDHQLDTLDAIDEVLFVGYPSGIYDSAHYLPIVRRGISASPLQVDYENQPQFLIDASVFPGSSGSPVFTFSKGQSIEFHGNQPTVTSGYLLGVVAEVMQTSCAAKLKSAVAKSGSPDDSPTQFLDIGVVFKSRTILEIALPLLRGSEEAKK